MHKTTRDSGQVPRQNAKLLLLARQNRLRQTEQRERSGSLLPLIQAHECWKLSHQNHPTQQKLIYVGTLNDLHQRVDCGLCQKIYNKMSENINRFEGHDKHQVHCGLRIDNPSAYSFTLNWPHKICNLENPVLKPVGRGALGVKRLNPEWMFLDEIKDRIHNCDTRHECRSRFDNSRPRESPTPVLTLIDVLAHCLTTGKPTDPYLALSYVWGGQHTYRLAKHDFAQLHLAGSLQELGDQIPQTIRDAMVLTARLDFRYLWVDTLCIVQDDYENKLKHIQQMSFIYSDASITIVAADGDHAGHGLRGVPGCLPRSHSPQDLLQCTPSFHVVLASTSLVDRPKKPYFTRGWTYQEYLLSSRLLVFVDNRVIWLCQEHEWQEGFYQAQSRSSCDTAFLAESVMGQELTYPDLWTYQTYVEQYNTRNLSYDSDALFAFSGVINRASPLFPGGFIQALPEFWFDVAMLWQPAHPVRRRTVTPEHHGLSSWSWVGWAGALDLDLWDTGICCPATAGRSYDIEIIPLVAWSKMTTPGGVPIDNSYHEYYQLRVPERRSGDAGGAEQYEPDFLTRVTSRPPNKMLNTEGWTLSTWNIGGVSASWPCYRHPAIDEPCSYPVPIQHDPSPLQSTAHRFLHCKTSRAYFHIGEPVHRHRTDRETSCVAVTLVDQERRVAGVLRLNQKALPHTPSSLFELVVISKGQANLAWTAASYVLEEASDLACLRRLKELRGGISTLNDKHGKEKSEDQYLRDCVGYYEFYNVLWVEWEDGVAYRRALGRVFRETWDEQCVEEVDLVLG